MLLLIRLKLKNKITHETGNGAIKNVEMMVTLKYLSNSWRTHEMPLSNCKINLDLNWHKNAL